MSGFGPDGHPIEPVVPPQQDPARPAPVDSVANQSLGLLRMRAQFGPQGIADIAAAHPGFATAPLTKMSDTALLLHSIGYTGNGPQDFNATVDRINQTFEDAYGHPPTPGLVMDMIRSPLSQSPGALRRLWQGTLGQQPLANVPAGLTQQQTHGIEDYLTADQSHRQDLRYAIQQAVIGSLVTGKDYLTPSVNLYQRQGVVDQSVAALQSGQPDAIKTPVMLTLSLPINTDGAANVSYAAHLFGSLGIDYATLTGSYEQNVRRVINATQASNPDINAGAVAPQTAALDARTRSAALAGLQNLRDVQQKIIDHYNLKGVQATGVLTGKWPTVLRDLQSSQSYTLTQYLIQAQDAGFGQGSFDAFNAVNYKTGSFANTPDGRKAQQELGRYRAALAGRQGTLEHGWQAPFLHAFYSSLPLGFFDKGGVTPGSIFSNILGGSSESFGDHLSHPWLSLNNPVFNTGGDIGNIVEQGLMRSGVGGFDAFNGAWNQGKVDTFAVDELLRGNGSLHQRLQAAGERLAANPPTWLDILLNSPQGQQQVAAKLKELGLGNTDAGRVAAVGDIVSNMAIDFWLTKKLSPSAIADLTGARALLKAGSTEERLAIAMRNPAIRSAIDSGYGLFQKGKTFQGIKKFDGVGDVFHQRMIDPATGARVDLTEPLPPEPALPSAPAPAPVETSPFRPPPAPEYNPKIPAELRSPAQLRVLDQKGMLDAKLKFMHSDEGFPQDATSGGLPYFRHETPVGNFYRVELPPAEGAGSLGEASIRVNPSGVAYIHNVKVVAEAQRTRAAGQLLQESFNLARQKGATSFIPDPTGLTEDGLRSWKALARRVSQGKVEGATLEGDAHVARIGESDIYNVVGQRIVLAPQTVADPLVSAEQSATAMAEDMHRGLPDNLLPAAGPDESKLLTIPEAVQRGVLDKQGFTEHVLEHTVVKPQLFNGIWNRTLPTKAESLFDPVNGWTDRLRHPYSTSIPHPFRFGRAKVTQGIGAMWDHIDATWPESRVPGAGLLHNAMRQFRVQAMRAANPNAMPLELYDPANIQKAALEVGMNEARANVLAFRFSQAMANHDAKDLLKISNELHDAGVAQGRNSDVINQMNNVFSAGVDRTAEHLKWTESADHANLFGSDGLFENRQWAALTAHRAGMTDAESAAAQATLKRELRNRGLTPIQAHGVYGGAGEPSFFVPGLTQTEAQNLGQMFGQESVLTPKGLLYTTGEDAGKVLPTEGVHNLGSAANDNFTEMTVGGKKLRWNMNLNFDKPPVDPHPSFFSSLPFGDARVLTQREHIAESLRRATSPLERQLLEAMLPEARNVATPIIPEEMIHQFSIPVLHAPIERSGFLNTFAWLNRKALSIGLWNRRFLLTTDPILFFKHATADTARRFFAEGGVRGWAASKLAQGSFDAHLAANPGDKGVFDSLYNLMQNGELRYNLGERGLTPADRVPRAFWTRDAVKWAKDGNKQPLHSAAAYIDRRLMSGAYQAWKDGGVPAIRDFFETNPAGKRLAAEENMPSYLLAEFVGRNLDTIHLADPTFLSEAERVRSEAKNVRSELANWMAKTDRNVPVTGHITEAQLHVLNPVDAFDQFSQFTIKQYMIANKMNRGGLFRDLSARYFSDFQKMGATPDEAFKAALAISKKVTRYHMLDLADALKAEQTFRWADYFLTKHRLYWTWILRTMANNPQTAVTVGNLANLLDKVGTKGNITFNLPFSIPGVESQGGKTSYTIPIARLFWLDPSATQPGAFSSGYHALDSGNWENAIPFTKNAATSMTTMDGSLKMLYMYLGNSTGVHMPLIGPAPVTSDQVLTHLNPTDGYRFKQAWWRIYASGQVADAWKGMSTHEIDAQVTHKALLHMTITGLWRNSAFTGGYINDPKLTDAQNAIWKQYNETSDPVVRAQMRQAHPFINGQLGQYNSSPVQHMLSNRMWGQFTKILDDHHARMASLLAKFKQTGDPRDLFGPVWNAEGDRYSKAIDQLKADAKKSGAIDWLGAFNKDPMIGVHQNLAAALHDIYPNLPQSALQQIPGVKNTKQASWIKVYENALKTDLSPAYIAKLPVEDQQAAYVQAAFYKSQLLQFASSPSNPAEKLRVDYYTKIYGPYKDQLNKLYSNAKAGLPTASSRSYELARQFMDSSDHPVKVDGYTFPSAQRLGWVLLPKDAQQAQVMRNSYKDWSWLSRFQKQMLGVKVDPGVQQGWSEFNNAIYQGTLKYQQTHNGSSPRINPAALLKVVQQVDQQHPGFLADYTRSLTPAYARILDTYSSPHGGIYGSTPNSKATWKAFFGELGSTAQGAIGAPLPAGNPALLMVWDSDFRKSAWTSLMTLGRPGVDNGIPLATPPTQAYPTGGYFWRWAMAQHDTVFRDEFRSAVHADPSFIEKLFSPGG